MGTVFAGGTVFDGMGAAPAGAEVAVEDGRIVDVGPGRATRSAEPWRRA